MINYTIADFLGIFFIFLPIFVFATIILFWGIRKICENLFEDEDDKNIYHHHFHYKDHTFAPSRRRSENL